MNRVLVIDFGSQYCKLIARRIREMNVYSEIIAANHKNIVEKAKGFEAIILSGGPSSVYDADAMTIDKQIFELQIPVLGICYGMQIMHHLLGGKVEKLPMGEYGKKTLKMIKDNAFTEGIQSDATIWMSHFDSVTQLAPGFEANAKTDLCNAITSNEHKKLYSTQFHIEVTETTCGQTLLSNFLFKIAKLNPDWNPGDILAGKIAHAKATIKDEEVILGLSGGVDSSVVALLLHKAIGNNLKPVLIDNGLLRQNEVQNIKELFKKNFDIDVRVVDAKSHFLEGLDGIVEPEQKRKIIGRVFMEEFEKAKEQYQTAKFLAQGTIYPDVIESSGTSGTAKVIKSHHNVGGLPSQFNFELYEPLRDLFKDEVRELGRSLGLPDSFINRHPFPGPGLGIRIIGSITEERIVTLQAADAILIQELTDAGYYDKVSQAAAILTNVKTVGVQGDERTYEELLAIRIVQTVDFMTAKPAQLPWELLEKISTEIINKVKKVNRVVYDITSKPPATIEWE